MLMSILISEQGLTIYDFGSIFDFMIYVFHTAILHKSKIIDPPINRDFQLVRKSIVYF